MFLSAIRHLRYGVTGLIIIQIDVIVIIVVDNIYIHIYIYIYILAQIPILGYLCFIGTPRVTDSFTCRLVADRRKASRKVSTVYTHLSNSISMYQTRIASVYYNIT